MKTTAPLPVFRFKIDFFVATAKGSNKGQNKPVCSGAFSECSGIEATMEPKAIKVGGMNQGEIQLAGRTNYSTVILKRGISLTRDMWNWFNLVSGGAYAYRLDAEIMLMNFADQDGEYALKWQLKNCLPTKFKTADLNATSTQIGVEELHLVHEGLSHE
ncbi:phage tail protein [Aliikangiella maris]|uniref:Phage tail protein n=2 Tax=Aliikangiella maris TaxID=3162458 RepID=A0ABV3MKK8_9GAMM